MASEVVLPKLGMNMESATILHWYKGEGDSVAVGEILAEVETDKTTTELEAEAAGVLRKVLVDEGERVAVNQPIAVIGTSDEDISALLQQASKTSPESHMHVKRVYEAWGSSAQSSPTLDRDHRSSAQPSRGRVGERQDVPGQRLDPEAIRARLSLRGALHPTEAGRSAPPRTRIVIYGAGLGAKQLLEVTRHLEHTVVVGLIDDNEALAGVELGGVPVLGGFSALENLLARGGVDGVALSFHSEVRRKVHRRLVAELGVRLVPLVDSRAVVGMDVQIADGALIEAGAVVGPGTVVGEGVIVDVGAVVAHDCFLGPFSHLSPGCTLSGVVSLIENALVGVGAAVNSTVTVGRSVIIAPGSAVMNDVPDDVVVSGVPAKVIGKSRRGG